MAVRKSGTTQRPPVSGPLSAPSLSTNPGSINVVNTSVYITGQTTLASSQNVGSVGNPTAKPYVNGILSISGVQYNLDGAGLSPAVFSTPAERQAAATYFAGGVGIEQDLAVGGFIYGRISQASTATTSSQLLVLATESNDEFFPAFTNKIIPHNGYPGANNLQDIGSNYLYGDPSGVTDVPLDFRTNITYNPALGRLTLNKLHITSTGTTTAVNSGSVVVDGGVGIAKDLYVGAGIYPGSTATSTIGGPDIAWASSYLNNIYTKFIGNNSGNINVSPNNGISNPLTGNGGVLDVFGDIRVRGNNPVGTAPVVTNVLYVTMDGDDTNDGRAMDTSRACRTITGAINSPYYQSGTQIRVSPGHYLENNPIQLKPYTSIVGSDLRTTSIEPINKTQDLFHMNSGCYLNYMQFLNGRSGLLSGQYANGFNRGAYATAFPPLTGSDRIDIFHSPYIQNCTNLSGPWLQDGSMFVPDQTVQIPTAVGTGTWVANTTSIIVNFQNLPVNGFINAGARNSSSTQYTGVLQNKLNFTGTVATSSLLKNITSPALFDTYTATDTGAVWVYTNASGIQLGQSINPGQQNPGFFNARTLMLANKPFLQWQVVSYVSNVLGIGTYSQALCYRDVGILIENVAYDVAFGGNEKSVESGNAYWNGVVSVIAGQENYTVQAIDYLSTLLQKVVVNTTCTVLTAVPQIPVVGQVRNTVMTGGEVTTASIISSFNIIKNIILGSPSVAPTVYNSQGPDAAYITAEVLLQANRTFIQENTLNYINYNLVSGGSNTYLPYNQIKCARDTGIIVDSIAADLLYPTAKFSQMTFAGKQYFAKDSYVTPALGVEITTTTAAVSYLQQLAVKVIQNITSATDTLLGFPRYSNAVQDTSNQPATAVEVATLNSEFNIITSILKGNVTGWTDQIVPNGTPSNLYSVKDAYASLLANVSYMQTEVIAYIDSLNAGFLDAYNARATCIRDIGYIINSVAFDLLHGGNRQAIQSGLSYYSQNANNSYIPGETTATVAAFNYLDSVINTIVTNPSSYVPLQTKVPLVTGLPLADSSVAPLINQSVSTLTNILLNGPTGYDYTPISLTASTDVNVNNAYVIIEANKAFLVAETISYINQTYNSGAFYYDQASCYRDIGLMVDAVSQDILLGGNQRSVEAGLSYWNQGYNVIANEVTTTTAAISYISAISQQIIANTPVTKVTGTIANQVSNPFYQYGGNYMPQQAVARGFNIISNIIANGPSAAPTVYAGGGLFALTGLNGADVKISPTITYINTISSTRYLLGLSEPTVGFGNNATLYVGDTHIFPLQDNEVETLSLQQTASTSTWNQRKVDPIGGMGGSLVDGAVVSDRSPIQSFVYDAFTQLTQGGRGVHITNNGYAQLVSVFTIFSSVSVQVDNGGIASIVNSNANFGDLCLVAKGYGKRAFSGTIFNPKNRAYPFSPAGSKDELDQYYPAGYWPHNGTVEVFLPDVTNRPHISLLMEVVPPASYINPLNSDRFASLGISFSGFITAQPSTNLLTAGAITLTGIDTTDVAVGSTVYILDQFGFPYDRFQYLHDEFGNYVDSYGVKLPDQSVAYAATHGVPNPNYKIWYASTGTIVSDINYNSITLNQALTAGGGFVDNNNYFTLYFCGNAYYTVMTSTVADSPYLLGTNILSTNTNAYYQGPAVSQITQHADTLRHLNSLIDNVIGNATVGVSAGNTVPQYKDTSLSGGNSAQPFIDLRFGYLTTIITATNINAALSVVPSGNITKTGPVPQNVSSAITLIQKNIKFLGTEIYYYVQNAYPGLLDGSTTQQIKCQRDVELICQQLIYDLETGGNYNMVYSGLSYWARAGTHHIVELGEAVTDPSLFPDGSTVNFYQQSYISASGYVFEYVGAGSNYGALPQRGRADPVQKQETVQLDYGKVYFTSTDQNGDFRIGPNLVISQATGVISGRTFTESLFANMTPFILAIETL